MFMKQIKMLVGTFNGKDQNLVNLQNIDIINIMIGIAIAGMNLEKKDKTDRNTDS